METSGESRRGSLPQGHQDWKKAAEVATECRAFLADVEEEQIADEPRSCYNCRYRRWTADAIDCLAVAP